LNSKAFSADRIIHISTLVTIVLLLVTPLVFLLVALVLRFPSRSGTANGLFLTFSLLGIAAVLPLFGFAVERTTVRKNGTKSLEEHSGVALFYSVNWLKLAIVDSIYVLGMAVYIIRGDIVSMLAFYPIGVFWSLVVWPTRTRRESFLKRLTGEI